MAGFGKITFMGEYFSQKIVNVLWYRSQGWLPLQGNPFTDVSAFVDSVNVTVTSALLACLPADYSLQTMEGVGYDDGFKIVTPSPILLTVGSSGGNGANPTMGAPSCAILDLRCGAQTNISGIGTSKRDRGYLAIGPMLETQVDNYSHLVPSIVSALETLAAAVAQTITVIDPAVSLVPIRIHQKFSKLLGVKILDWRTYSDVQGWAVRRVASYRRSRQPEA